MIKYIAFDLFGTVFDWRGTIFSHGKALYPYIDWYDFAAKWKDGYTSSSDWLRLDNKMETRFWNLISNREFYKLTDLNNYDLELLSKTWSKLIMWDDAYRGLIKIVCDPRYQTVALSNANKEMQVTLDRYNLFNYHIHPDHIKKYKPDPLVYQNALNILNCDPQEILMVASHIFDLNAAKKVGFKTCLITRELEPGCDPKDLDHAVDYIFNSIEHLAEKVRAL